jgi:hypothetical protein
MYVYGTDSLMFVRRRTRPKSLMTLRQIPRIWMIQGPRYKTGL